MPIAVINNIFSDEDLESIRTVVSNSDFKIDGQLGRVSSPSNILSSFDKKIIDKFTKIVNDIDNTSVVLNSIVAAKYSPLHGEPNLPPHFDGDGTDLIVNFQIEANTVWDVGLDTQVYKLEDNSAIVFHPNKNVHWRTHKRFADGEYVNMLFIRFCDLENRTNYLHLMHHLDHPRFKDARDFRDSLGVF